ncbi:hypothetical protein [uncultured Sulfuricurvum sp.]|uniref:hypothetical protein n=1 Tax=uncultured Sulfuricurvum sp. TaxID=430693 RepID=UPI00262859F0|nr:hypothetical protein [uncultured Sulfuricurvum sp.]
MQKFVFIMFLFLSISINSFAESDEDIRQYEEMINAKQKEAVRNIPKLITQYATTLGCNDYFDPKNVVKFKMNDEIVYIGLFSIDTGCSGGTAMSRPVIITLRKSISYPEIYVDARSSAPYQTSNELPQNMSRIYVHNNKLWYEAKEFDFKKDALCCPSIPVRGELRFENGMWKGYPISKK